MKSFMISFATTITTKVLSKSNAGGVVGGTIATLLLNRNKKSDMQGIIGTGLGALVNTQIDKLQTPAKAPEQKILVAPVQVEPVEPVKENPLPPPQILEENTRIIGGDPDSSVVVPAIEPVPVVQDLLQPPKTLEFKVDRSNNLIFIDVTGDKPFVNINFADFERIITDGNNQAIIAVSPSASAEIVEALLQIAEANAIQTDVFVQWV